jgi:hypothetical protein
LQKKNRDLLDTSIVYTTLAESRDLSTRAKLREEIRQKVDRVEMTFYEPYRTPYGVFKDAAALIVFVNGAKWVMTFESGGAFLIGIGEPVPPKGREV